MKKIIPIVILSSIFISSTSAQVHPGSSNNNSVYMGHIIRLIPAGSNGFGYDIFFKSKIVVHQSRNPFTLAPTGLRSGEDALKMAHWQIQQLWHDKQHNSIMNRVVSKDVAKRLNVTIN